MALRLPMLKNACCYTCSSLSLRRLAHVAAAPPPLDSAISTPSPSQPLELPEYYQNPDSTTRDISGIGFGFPSVPFSGSMELMAVPKKKISKHKRGIRNGPKALKPVPVIVRCKSCGRVKLPHFFCCSGERRPE